MVYKDPFFTYKYSLKHLIILKLGYHFLNNVSIIPYLFQLKFFFSLSKITDKNNISFYNYFYLFKFFFGKNAFISKYKRIFNLGIWYYTFTIFISINKNEIYYNIYFLLNDFLTIIEKSFFKHGIYSNKLNILYIVLQNLSIFNTKKTNLGLFYLQDNLNIHLFFSGGDINSSKLILKNLKIKVFN